MKKIQLLLLAAVTLGYHYAQGYTFRVTNRLPYNKTLWIKVGVSNDFCGDNVQGPIKPGKTSIHKFTGGCSLSCFNKLEVKGDTDSHFFPVKYLDKGEYKGVDWSDWKVACGDKRVAIIGEKSGFYVVPPKN